MTSEWVINESTCCFSTSLCCSRVDRYWDRQKEKWTEWAIPRVAVRKKIQTPCGKHCINTSSLIGHPWEGKLSVVGSWVDERGELGDRCCFWKPAWFERNWLPVSHCPSPPPPHPHRTVRWWPSRSGSPPTAAPWACSLSGLSKHRSTLEALHCNAWLLITH